MTCEMLKQGAMAGGESVSIGAPCKGQQQLSNAVPGLQTPHVQYRDLLHSMTMTCGCAQTQDLPVTRLLQSATNTRCGALLSSCSFHAKKVLSPQIKKKADKPASMDQASAT